MRYLLATLVALTPAACEGQDPYTPTPVSTGEETGEETGAPCDECDEGHGWGSSTGS